MIGDTYSLSDLATATGFEERTIRSYIERGLLPGAQARGRAANYSKEHLSRLQLIRSVKRARPNVGLGEIRIFLEGLSPEQIGDYANGSITVATRVGDGSIAVAGDSQDVATDDDDETSRKIYLEQVTGKLTGIERLVCVLREVSGFASTRSTSKVEAWQRIGITPDIELSVRAGFDDELMRSFRELADLLRNLLQRTDALSAKGDE